MRIRRQSVVTVLLAALAIPAAGFAGVCCAMPVTDRPSVAASCCCPAECAVQAESCDQQPLHLDLAVRPSRANEPTPRTATWLSTSTQHAFVRLTNNVGPLVECTQPVTASCQKVNLPLRL